MEIDKKPKLGVDFISQPPLPGVGSGLPSKDSEVNVELKPVKTEIPKPTKAELEELFAVESGDRKDING